MFKKFLKIFFLFSLFLLPVTFALAQTMEEDEDRPILNIITPQEGEQILGSKVVVSFIVNNFIFTDFHKRTKSAIGEGHIHLWLDEKNPSLDNAQEAIRAADITLENIPEGDHRLILELVNNDHSSLKTPVSKTIRFKTFQTRSPTIVKQDENKNNLEKRKKLRATTFFFLTVAIFVTFVLAFSAFLTVRSKKN